jgi:predicted N-acetyltransferase YhbS
MTIIRPERFEDIPAIRVVNVRAFKGEAEARLIDALRKAGKLAVSLVAQQHDQVDGHILFAPVMVANALPVMVLELKDGALKGIGGLVKFAPEFHQAGC